MKRKVQDFKPKNMIMIMLSQLLESYKKISSKGIFSYKYLKRT